MQRKERQNKQVEIPNKFYLQDKEFGSQNVTKDAKQRLKSRQIKAKIV